MTSDTPDLEAQANRLEANGRYRVLRRVEPRVPRRAAPGEAVRHGLFVDGETTGLDPARHEIIELAMALFTYTVSAGAGGR